MSDHTATHGGAAATTTASDPIAIVVPVYADWASLKRCLAALTRYARRHDIVIVNDCGPEADLLEKRILRRVRRHRGMRYVRNEANLGFVQTCNWAVRDLIPANRDVLLLNSDAVVTRGALAEMHAVLYAEPKLGAVCPRSNAASVFSVPMPGRAPGPMGMKQSYRLYRRLRERLPRYRISPVAHGFCMLIRREVIEAFGLFDEAYGKGYGEENDFCMRIREHGWRCAVANHAYVFHYKARSFGEEQRSELVERNERLLDARYPGYRRLVAEYLETTAE